MVRHSPTTVPRNSKLAVEAETNMHELIKWDVESGCFDISLGTQLTSCKNALEVCADNPTY